MDPAIKELHQRNKSNVPALLFNIAAIVLAVYCLAAGWPTQHWLFIAACIVWLVYMMHCWMIIFHEDAHYALYKDRWHNRFNGVIVGTFLMLPFTIFQQAHFRHHAKMNTPDDFELWPYVEPKTSLGFRRFFVLLDIFLGIWVAPWIYARIFFVKDSPISSPKLRRRVWTEYAIIAAFWGTLITLVAVNGWWLNFTLAYIIPGFLAGMVQTLRKFQEHLGLPADSPMGGARTVMGKGPIAAFIDWTSFHIRQHGLHHAFPNMPHNRLGEALEKMEADKEAKVFTSNWAAIKDMLPHLWRPAIGEACGDAGKSSQPANANAEATV